MKLVTSAVTCEEYLVFVYRNGNKNMEDTFFKFLSDCDVDIADITRDIAKKAAHIRADYPGFKAMDALHLATACLRRCNIFLTNDKQLLQFHDLHCIMLEHFFEKIRYGAD